MPLDPRYAEGHLNCPPPPCRTKALPLVHRYRRSLQCSSRPRTDPRLSTMQGARREGGGREMPLNFRKSDAHRTRADTCHPRCVGSSESSKKRKPGKYLHAETYQLVGVRGFARAAYFFPGAQGRGAPTPGISVPFCFFRRPVLRRIFCNRGDSPPPDPPLFNGASRRFTALRAGVTRGAPPPPGLSRRSLILRVVGASCRSLV